MCRSRSISGCKRKPNHCYTQQKHAARPCLREDCVVNLRETGFPLCNHRFHLGWVSYVVGPALDLAEHWRQAVGQPLPKQHRQET